MFLGNMDFFASAEAYKTVSRELVEVQNVVADKLKLLLHDKNYGIGILDWGHISICCPQEFYDAGFYKEIKKYVKKKRDLDLRLKINYEEMLKANRRKIFSLICHSILKGVDIAEHELKIPDFDFEEFRKDVTQLFKKEGWI